MYFDDDYKEEHFPKRYVTKAEHDLMYPNGAVITQCDGCGVLVMVPECESYICADCLATAATEAAGNGNGSSAGAGA
jgi:hypothetical protein